jgi:hypothetical protein
MRNLLVGTAAAAALMGGTGSAAAAPVNIPAVQSTVKYQRTATGATGQGNYARATSKVVFDSATGLYTLRDTGSLTTTSTFGPANITSSAGAFTRYSKTSGATTETLRLLNQSPANPLIALSYTGYGQWRRSTTNSTGAAVNDTYLVYGTKTASADVPRIGSAHYSTILDGTFVNKNGAYAVSGTGNLTANFAGSSILYDATATGTKEVGGASLPFGTMTGSGTITFASSGFKGTGVANGSGYTMDVNGNFFGPAAAEVGGLFRITGVGGNGQGAMVGKGP